MQKIIIYQVLPRLFGNSNHTNKKNGTVAENGCGKFSSFNKETLHRIRALGVTHVWFTGILRHATQTDYSSFGIPSQHAQVVKGKAGSPYAIVDYYDVDPDLADNVSGRMQEWESLIDRTHEEGMSVIMDFVPNHVGREYHSISKPDGVRDLGEDDNPNMNFSPSNNFYYCWGQPLNLQNVLAAHPAPEGSEPYIEQPAKATGNDQFTSYPGPNDWYETVKLNYGIDYCDAGGRSNHFTPLPDTWKKMTSILLYWAAKGVDGFRCDMAEMVPAEFWAYATKTVKKSYPKVIFIGEVYNPSLYHTYIESGFDYLYDKVGMYDTLRSVIRDERPASSITYEWQATDDIHSHMLYFLENHDEQRIASDFFAGNPRHALPAVIVSVLMRGNPFMLYSGQEFGERGMDEEGYSGRDGRTTIFDYWTPSTLGRAYKARRLLTKEERELNVAYRTILNTALLEKAISEGDFFDLMYVNPQSADFSPRHQYAFLRKKGGEVILVVANFSDNSVNIKVRIPSHAFDFLQMSERKVAATDLLTGDTLVMDLKRDGEIPMQVDAYFGRMYKFNIAMADNGNLLNEHHKDEFPPAHTAEHLLNQLMVRMFGCERSTDAHIERKKSKITYKLDHKPTRQDEKEIERRMNELIQEDLEVSYDFVDRYHLPEGVRVDRLPQGASDMIRIVRIGDFDVCPCLGKHVRSTSQIGRFEILGTNWNEMEHTYRIRFKIVQ